MISQTKTLKIKSFLPFNFAITKICVDIHVYQRMDQELVAYSFDYPLVVKIIYVKRDLLDFLISCNTEEAARQIQSISTLMYGTHSVPKTFNKLNYLTNKINQFSVFNKITLPFVI